MSEDKICEAYTFNYVDYSYAWDRHFRNEVSWQAVLFTERHNQVRELISKSFDLWLREILNFLQRRFTAWSEIVNDLIKSEPTVRPYNYTKKDPSTCHLNLVPTNQIILAKSYQRFKKPKKLNKSYLFLYSFKWIKNYTNELC